MDSSALKLRAQYRSFQLFQFEKCISRHFHFRIFVHCSPKDYVMRKVKFIQMREFTHTPRNFDAVEKVLSVSYKIIYICILLLVWRGGDTDRVVSEWVCVCVRQKYRKFRFSTFLSFISLLYSALSVCATLILSAPQECYMPFSSFSFFYPFYVSQHPNQVSDVRVRSLAPIRRKYESKVKYRSWDNIVK